jgi:cell wall-associated NlpC family hydrolase
MPLMSAPVYRSITAAFCALGCVVVSASAHAMPPDALGDFLQNQGLLPAPSLGSDPSLPGSVTRPSHSQLVVHAMGYVGVPYQIGGSSYTQGFDCSGFVQASFQQSLGLALPRRAAEQAAATQSITPDELHPGDLVFYNTLGQAFSHVGIYVGEGRFIHSPRSGASVRLENMKLPYWVNRFNGARRVFPLDIAATPTAWAQ